MTKKERAKLAVEKLKELYPDAVCSLKYNKDKPYELLISTRLSAQCTDARVNIVTKDLFKKYQSLQEFANADISDVENIIRSCGFYKVKSADVVNMSNQLIDNYNGELPDSIEELTKLSGIGRKTANLIMGDIYNQPAIVADTHCIRICGRLGLTSGTTNPLKVENELRKVLNPADSCKFCHRLVHFGRDICNARKPKCSECKLYDICKNPQFKK